jgi:hypothetical protein
MACALLLHLAAPMHSYLGESDSVAFVTDALLWVKGGIRSNLVSEYRYYTSPGYIWLVTRLLPDASSATVAAAATVMNRINVAMSALIVVPFFLVARRLIGARAAAMATLLVSFVPTFWQGGEYGFPTLPAEFFLLWAIWGFDRWLASERPRRHDAWWLVFVEMCLLVTVLLKVDVYLGAVALWGLLALRRCFTWSNAMLLVVIGVVPVALSYAYSSALLVNSASTATYVGAWETKFPLDPTQALSWSHLLQLAKSMGVFTLPLFVVALAWLVKDRRALLAALLAAWAATPVLFWYFRVGDSARHHVPASVPVALGVATLLAALPVRAIGRYAALALLVAVNYATFPPSANTAITSGRLIGSGERLAATLAYYYRPARELAGEDVEREAYVGSWRRIWYYQAEVMGRADSILGYQRHSRYGFPAIDVEYLRGGRVHVLTSVAAAGQPPERVREVAARYERDGYRVLTFEYDSTLEHLLPPNRYHVAEYGGSMQAVAAR